MRANVLSLGFLLLSAAALPARGQSASEPGQIFDFGAGGRALGMGSAYTAMVQDATSLYYNPSGLGLLSSRQVTLMRAQLFGGAAYDYLGYAQNFRRRPGGWGVQVLRLGVAGGEGRDAANLKTSGFSYSETAFGLGMGLRGIFLPELSLGTGVKMLSRQLAGSSDRLMGLDLGAQYGPVASERLMLGFVVQNAASKSTGDTVDKLSARMRLGAAYRVLGPLLLAMDVSDSRELRFGTEYAWGFASLRAGFAPEGVSFGGGFLFKKAFSLDLAVLNSPTLGLSQRVSVGYRFGARKTSKRAAIASEYLGNAEGELQARRYAQAAKDFETALALDSSIDDGKIRRKAERLRELVKGMEIESQPSQQAELSGETPAARYAHRSISSYLSGEDSEAMLLAHVSAGSSEANSVFRKLLQSMSRATGQSVVREDIVSAERFLAERMKRSVDAIYLQRYDLAIRACREALVIVPEDGLAWTRLGSSYYAAGDRAKSREAYQKAVAYNPQDEKLREFLQENFEPQGAPKGPQ